MANANAATTVWNSPNYVGELFLIGQNQTPFLNAIGGIQGGGKVVNSWAFACGQTYAQEAASQPAITETASLTAPTPWTYVRSQDTNVCQIFHEQVSVSYAKQSNSGTIAGISVTGQIQPVQNEFEFQRNAALKQVAKNADYTFINGVYAAAANAGQPNKTRGIQTAITTNAVAGGAAYLTKDMINTLVKTMVDNGADMSNLYLWANSFQIQLLTDIYGYVPQSRTVGGLAITEIITDFGLLQVRYEPNMPTTAIGVYDMNKINVVFLPVPGKGVLFYEELSKTGASETGQIYGQMGIDYGPEEMHGKITGLLDA